MNKDIDSLNEFNSMENPNVNEAMDINAKQVAMAFAEWICKNGFDSIQITVSPKWRSGNHREYTSYTSEQLFELFKQEEGI